MLRLAIHQITALATGAGLPLGGLVRPGISFGASSPSATAKNSLTIAPANQVAGHCQPFADSLRPTLGLVVRPQTIDQLGRNHDPE